MKNYVFIAVAIIFVAAGIYLSSSNPTTGQGKLDTSHLSYDFGQLMMNAGNVSHEFILKNTNDKPITIKDVSTSCMCTTAYLEYEGKETGPFGMSGHNIIRTADINVEPGKEIALKAVFDPAAHGPGGAGRIERKIYVNTDSSSQPQIIFSFSANVNL